MGDHSDAQYMMAQAEVYPEANPAATTITKHARALESERDALTQMLADAHGLLADWKKLADSAADHSERTEDLFTSQRIALAKAKGETG